MGTRADFYIRRGRVLRQVDWIGAIAWDGYPEGVPNKILEAETEEDFLKAVQDMKKDRDDFVDPEKDGWPWPWENSYLTDYVYVFNTKTKKVKYKSFDKVTKFPDMSDYKKATGKSGFLHFVVKK